MKVKRVIRIFLCCLLAGSFIALNLSLAGEEAPEKLPFEVSAGADHDKVTIGDKITYTITVRAAKDIEIEFPEFGENLGDFAIKDFASYQKGWLKTKTYRQWYVLDTYASGEYKIPSVAIKYKGKGEDQWQNFFTNEVAVKVESVLAAAENKSDIRGIFGPVNYRRKVPWYVWAILLVSVLVFSAVIFLFKRKKSVEMSLPVRPAHEIAYEALDALEKKEYLIRGEAKKYYIELSDIARRYLENRYNLRAPEMTTEEFLKTVKDEMVISDEIKSLLRDFLSHCDLVKFAKYLPREKEAGLSFDSAKKLIDETKKQLITSA
ncbi:MAG: hypothetical protein ABH858_05130 [Candidatus Omnitrophota bacterium]